TVSCAPVIADAAAVCDRPRTFGTLTVGAGAPASSSTIAMFQRSLVGADAFSVIDALADGVVLFSDCTQNVSPTGVSTNSWTFVWPDGIVRAAARSQSLPTA